MMQFNKLIKNSITCIAFILLCLPAKAQEPVKVLFLGNSYTFYNNTPDLVKNFSESAGIPMIIQSRMPGGCYVANIEQGDFAHANNDEVYAMIRSMEWDYLVIQDNQGYFCGTVGSDFPEVSQVIPGHLKLRDSLLAVNPCGKVILFSGWAVKDPYTWAPWLGLETAQEANTRIFERYQDLNEHMEHLIAPIGIAWNYLLDSMPSVDPFSPDESHPSYEGSYLAAATIFTTISKMKTTDAPFNGSLAPELATQMKAYAYKAVMETQEAANLKPVLHLMEDGMLMSDPGYIVYQWFMNGELMPEATSPAVEAVANTCFQLMVKDENGCEYYSMEYCFGDDIPTDIKDVSKAGKIKCYPNPATDILTIEQPETTDHTTAVITDITGKVMQQLTIAEPKIEVSLQNYMPGIYLLKITNGVTMKFVKQ